MNEYIQQLKTYFVSNYTVASLKMLIIVWSIAMIVVAITIDNPLVLAGVLAYEVLP